MCVVYNGGVLERGDHRQGKPLRPGKAKEGTRPERYRHRIMADTSIALFVRLVSHGR